MKNLKAMLTNLLSSKRKRKTLKEAIKETDSYPFFVETPSHMSIIYAKSANEAIKKCNKWGEPWNHIISVSCV